MCLAVPTRIREIEGETAVCEVHGGQTHVEASLLLLDEEVAVGDYVLLHAGFALRKLDESEAAETLALFRELAQSVGEMGEKSSYSPFERR
ncbi:MAG: HypC/HybG/HupF family hydrogenase formation chaperone [Desulfohalobiaceae bacterium]|nr:HypC/HybG/HupF family hydrogenase formation chaperone [Desulfohalobiaceae bacterium]